jgi:murein DD-endopeptidase MepM/ murein hydrolase activator NlpD
VAATDGPNGGASAGGAGGTHAPAPIAVTLTDVAVVPEGGPSGPPAAEPGAEPDESIALRVDLAGPTPAPPTPSPMTEGAPAKSGDAGPPELDPDALVRPRPTPARAAAIWLLAGCGLLALVQVPLALSTRHAAGSGSAAWVAPSGAPSSSASASVALASASTQPVPAEPSPPSPPAFRVAQLEQDPALEITHARVGKRGCEAALAAIGVEKTEIARVAKAMAPVRKLTACRATDQLFVATTREGRKVRALEIELSPGELVQLRERSARGESRGEASAPADAGADASGTADDLVAERISLPVSHRRQAVGLIVQTDLAAAVIAAGLDASILEPLDDAIDGRGDLGPITRGAVFRIVADATFVGGRFDRYDKLVAFEYRASLSSKPVRVYNLPEPPPPSAEPKPPPPSWFDAAGHGATRSRWRMPVLIPRVTSRFNPRRMHPILHTIMPHNGCDFGAPSGTPVYAIGPGVVTFKGDAGATGNFVSVRHEGGFESGYAHLSRFAPGIGPGTHVEGRQLVGYVGSTGRSTGPHLHLSVKKDGQFIDPLTLRLDSKKVVPPKQRDAFAKQRADADAALDAIALPKPDKPEQAAAPPSTSASGAASAKDDSDPIDDEHPR